MQPASLFDAADDAQLAAAMQQLQPPSSRNILHPQRRNPLQPPHFNPTQPSIAAAAPTPTAIDNVKLPTFDMQEPTLWFQQAESIFRRKAISAQLDRYDVTVAHLPTITLQAVGDLIATTNDTTADAYTRLKTRLLATYGKTPIELANSLLDHPSLGDARPTHLMNSLLSHLPPGETPGTIFLALFLRRLPTYLREQLASYPTHDLNALAAHADHIWTAHGGATAAINKLTTEPPPTTSRRRSPTPYRRRSPSPSRSSYCFYHQRFGDRAQKCQPPCSYKPKNG
jgi:hypothetical protein